VRIGGRGGQPAPAVQLVFSHGNELHSAMTTETQNRNGLHLPDLAIEGFRGIGQLSIPRLARVTLLAGKNGAGKTTVLEAVRAYAARGEGSVLGDILYGREEFSSSIDESGDTEINMNWPTLFYRRSIQNNPKIQIGPRSDILTIELVDSNDKFTTQEELHPDFIWSEGSKVIKIHIGKTDQTFYAGIIPEYRHTIPPMAEANLRRLIYETERAIRPLLLKYGLLGPGLLSNGHIAEFWDRVALTDAEDKVVEALRLVLGGEVERATVIGSGGSYRRNRPDSVIDRRVLVKLKGYDRPVPLSSCGDGAVRLFGIALTLANSAGGILLIDEAENGLHWSVERDFWRMVLRTARENDVQVLATTHSWDCIVGFAKAVNETPEEDGLLLRLDRAGGRIRAIDYTEDQLRVAADQRIEVR